MSKPYTPATDAEFATAPVVIRARSQIARLQAVIDYGEGDVGRAVKIRDILEGSVLHCRQHGDNVAIAGNRTLLDYTLHDWSPAIDSVCAELERSVAA